MFVSCLLKVINYIGSNIISSCVVFRHNFSGSVLKFAFDRHKILTNLDFCWFVSAVYLILYHPFFIMLMISYWRTICASSGLVPSQVWQLLA